MEEWIKKGTKLVCVEGHIVDKGLGKMLGRRYFVMPDDHAVIINVTTEEETRGRRMVTVEFVRRDDPKKQDVFHVHELHEFLRFWAPRSRKRDFGTERSNPFGLATRQQWTAAKEKWVQDNTVEERRVLASLKRVLDDVFSEEFYDSVPVFLTEWAKRVRPVVGAQAALEAAVIAEATWFDEQTKEWADLLPDASTVA